MTLDLAKIGATRNKKQLTEDAIAKARLLIMNKSPFFATIVTRLVPVEAPWCESNGFPAAATEGKHFFYHPDILDVFKLNENREFLVLHEVLHAAYGHSLRIGGRDPLLWNFACDFAVNAIIDEMGFKVMEDSCFDKKYKGMSAEQIYEALKKDKKFMQSVTPPDWLKPGDNGDGQGAGKSGKSGKAGKQKGDGTPSDGKPRAGGEKKFRIIDVHVDPRDYIDKKTGPRGEGSPGEGEEGFGGFDRAAAEHLTELWRSYLIEAELAQDEANKKKDAKHRGSAPGQLAELIKEIKKPKSNIVAKLAHYVQMAVTSRPNWNIGDRRWNAAFDIYKYSFKNQVLDGVFIIDTSGSISKTELEYALGTADEIIRALPITKIRYMEVDTAIAVDREIDIADNAEGVHGIFSGASGNGEIKIHGRGGTSFVLPFERLKEEDAKPGFVVYISADMDGSMPEKMEFPFPVIWLCSKTRCREGVQVPFGEIEKWTDEEVIEWNDKKTRAAATSAAPGM